jgi:Holliday junction resolvasome RuvABC endonuclease subunit
MKTPSNAVGIDVSLTNTAMYFGPGQYEEIKGGSERGVTRLRTMHDKILAHLLKHKPEVAVIEGYAFAARSRQHRLGEIGGVVRLACATAGVRIIHEVPPTTLKKFFTGGGKASKEDMQNEAVRRGDFSTIPSNDLADACALWYAAADTSLLRTKAESESLTH